MRFGLFCAKVKSKLEHSYKPLLRYYRKQGVTIGKNCLICSHPLTAESYLIEIGNNVVVSSNVTFVTHDHSVSFVHPDKTDLFGKIIIGNHCFIGQNSVLMYGITIADNVIVAAGSVVTKSITESNVIVGGNPARVISTWDKYREKTEKTAMRRSEMTKDSPQLVKR